MASILRSVHGPGLRPITGPHTGGTLLPETQDFEDRVLASGGSIESGALEGLYDPLLREAKDAGWYSDLLFFGAGSAVEDVSGSVATIFDASGNKDDAAQGTSSSRATLNKTGIGGRWTLDFDGSNDKYSTPTTSVSQPYTIITVAQVPTDDGDIHPLTDGLSGNRAHVPAIRFFEPDRLILFENIVTASGADTDIHVWSALADGGSSLFKEDGSQVASGDAGTDDYLGLHIGSNTPAGGNTYADMNYLLNIVANGDHVGSDSDPVRQIINDFYSL